MTASAPARAGWAEALTAGTGLRRGAVAFAGGVVAALALPPLHLIFLLIPAFVLLALLLERAEGRGAAFGVGWFFGFGFFVAGLYWLGLPVVVDIGDEALKDLVLAGGIGGTAAVALGLGFLLERRFGGSLRAWRRVLLHALAWLAAIVLWAGIASLLVPARFGWMVPLAVYGLSAGLALFPAAGAWGLAALRLRGPALVLALPVAWVAMEWVRGHILTGFPWNLIATVWAPFPAMQQSAAWVGAYGLSFLTVLIATLPALAAVSTRRGERYTGLAAPLLILVALWAFGLARIPSAPVPTADGILLRLVQPAIPQDLKWDSDAARRNLERHIALSRDAAAAGITHIVWPETAASFFLTTNAPDPGYKARVAAFRRGLAALVPEGGALVTGAVRPDHLRRELFNSIQAVNAEGDVTATYDKHHLVPFGEYVPARRILGTLGVERLAQGQGDFAAGKGPRTLSVPSLPPFSPLVCYEAIFPGEAVDPGNRPAWLLNLTNDGWFGTSSGPYQHFASARLRAVEQGLPLVRSANTGISAIVDPYGRVRKRLGLNQVGVIDGELPTALNPTVYSRFGNSGLLIILAIAVLMVVVVRRRRDLNAL